jgi:hypothetical protein
MRRETRSGLATVFWLTIYVGFMPLIVIIAAMFALSDLDEDLGVVWAALYLVLVYFGAQLYSRHFERRGG